MSKILEQLEKMEGVLRAVLLTGGSSGEEMVSAIHRHTMLVAREGFVHGCKYMAPSITFAPNLPRWKCAASDDFPLPPKKVLREVPVPGTDSPRFRFNDGALEANEGWGWQALNGSRQIDFTITPERIILWKSLLDNPYTEVPDEG
jgi:hypothetical protein